MTFQDETAPVIAGQPSGTTPSSDTDERSGSVTDLRVIRVTGADWPRSEAWAGDQGWIQGRGDGAVYLRADPDGFFAGFVAERHVSSIAIINYDETFAFCGMFLVDPALRGKGLGTATWEAAIGHAGRRAVGADAPPELQDYFKELGFASEWRNIRFAGPIPPPRPALDPRVIPADIERHLKQMIEMDAACFPALRPEFAAGFATAPERVTLVYDNAKGGVEGYGVLRPARGIARIGPLYAKESYIAAAIFDGLCDRARDFGVVAVSMDSPEPNPAAAAVAETRGMSHVGETLRMYRPGAIGAQRVDLSKLYGLTSVELG